MMKPMMQPKSAAQMMSGETQQDASTKQQMDKMPPKAKKKAKVAEVNQDADFAKQMAKMHANHMGGRSI